MISLQYPESTKTTTHEQVCIMYQFKAIMPVN